MVAATAVDVASIDDLPAANLQETLSAIYGKSQYAANAAGAAEYKADQAQAKADSLEGSVAYATSGVGTIDYHLREIAALVGYTGYPSSI